MSDDHYRTVVTRQHVRHREIAVLVALLVMAVVLALGYFLGQRSVRINLAVEPEEKPAVAEQELLALQAELEVQRLQSELDRTAQGIVRREIAAQKEQIANLEEGLRFYKGLMAPEEITQGLSLRKLELIGTEFSDRFVFRLVAQQEALKHATLKGSLSIELFGRQGGGELAYSLADISDDIEGNPVTLRFRYFQPIEGELVLPAGFTPQEFRVIAKASAPREMEVREQFQWDVQERFTYVGK